MNAVTDFQRVVHKPLSVIEFNIPFSNCSGLGCPLFALPIKQLQEIRDYGALPVLSWASTSSPILTNEPAFRLRAISDGKFDSYIRSFAASARRWGHPFFLRFDWEMNGNWFPWSEAKNGNHPGDFVRAWRRIHRIFSQEHAHNVTWVWCPYISRSPGAQSLARYYPGNAYVDWTCLDGYNFGPLFNGPGGWHSFDSIYSASYDEVTKRIATHKPMLIGEVASSQFGGSKAHWIRHMFSELPTRYPKIRAVVWWDTVDLRPSYSHLRVAIEDSTASARAFSLSVANPIFAGNKFGSAAVSPIPPP